MLLDSLKIQNFRALEDLEINQLGRINLIVGKNNVGKSSLLEAIEIYASLGFPLILEQLLKRHNENYNIGADEKTLAIENFFTQRKLPKNETEIYIGNKEKTTYVKLKPTYSVFEEVGTSIGEQDVFIKTHKRKEISYAEIENYEKPRQSLKIETQNNKIASKENRHNFNPEGVLYQWVDFTAYDKNAYQISSRSIEGLNIPYKVIPTGFISVKELAKGWDSLTPNDEKEVINALNFIDNTIESLKFRELSNEISTNEQRELEAVSLLDVLKQISGERTERYPFVYTKDCPDGVPLNSMGDGIRRILQLFISMEKARDGFLLIDEFENGLHYSVQTEVWQLLFKLAKQRNIQIFATTHSLDCVKGFQKASEKSGDLAMLFNFSRSRLTTDNNKIIVDGYDKENLKNLVESEWELR